MRIRPLTPLVVAEPENGEAPTTMEVYDFKSDGGVALAMYNTDDVSGASAAYRTAFFLTLVGKELRTVA